MEKSAETLSYVIQEALVAHLVGFFDPRRSLIARDSMASILKGWKNSLLMRPVMPVHSLEVLDGFVSRYLNSLVGCLHSGDHPSRYHHVRITPSDDIVITLTGRTDSRTAPPRHSHPDPHLRACCYSETEVLLRIRSDKALRNGSLPKH
jgi:hypothetical protein